MIKGYSKVYGLGHKAIADLFKDSVIVEEKIDGSQISWMKDEQGIVHVRSHHKELILDAPDKMFKIACEVITNMTPLLHPGWIYRGEYLSKPCHNALAYDRVPENNIVLFDIDAAEEDYIADGPKRKEAKRLGLECVPQFAEGKFDTWEGLKKLLDNDSFLGGQKIEGIVIKNYNRFGRDGHALMGKYVSEKYKEVHDTNWKEKNPAQKEIKEQIILALRTPARWNKAVQHLRESGDLQNALQDIGPLIKEVQKDVKEECTGEIADRLVAWAIQDIMRGVVRGLPVWYKEQLATQQFAE